MTELGRKKGLEVPRLPVFFFRMDLIAQQKREILIDGNDRHCLLTSGFQCYFNIKEQP